jgi:hypothetical protein
MDIKKVIKNLHNTIYGKELFLESTKIRSEYWKNLNDQKELLVAQATISFLEVNIGELKRILNDLKICV